MTDGYTRICALIERMSDEEVATHDPLGMGGPTGSASERRLQRAWPSTRDPPTLWPPISSP